MINQNMQPKESRFNDPEGILQVHSIWRTIQGEGPFAGTPAIFVRLAGCNLQCPWCDTDYTSRRTPYHPSEIVTAITDLGGRGRVKLEDYRKSRIIYPLVVFTGGEPMRQNIAPVLWELENLEYQTQVETNGAFFVENLPETTVVVCSPKTPKIHPSMELRIDDFKYVLEDGHIDPTDGLPSRVLGGSNCYRPSAGWMARGGDVFVQPMDAQDDNLNKRNLQATLQSAMKFNYRLCLQIHKLVGMP